MTRDALAAEPASRLPLRRAGCYAFALLPLRRPADPSACGPPPSSWTGVSGGGRGAPGVRVWPLRHGTTSGRRRADQVGADVGRWGGAWRAAPPVSDRELAVVTWRPCARLGCGGRWLCRRRCALRGEAFASTPAGALSPPCSRAAPACYDPKEPGKVPCCFVERRRFLCPCAAVAPHHHSEHLLGDERLLELPLAVFLEPI